MEGKSFAFDTNDEENQADEEEYDFMNFPNVENHLNPLDLSFEEQKQQMSRMFEGIWKKILKSAPAPQKSIDLSRHRVTYHRNFFLENEMAPFDSTYLIGKPDVVVCSDTRELLEGFLESLGTMKEGEISQFIVSSSKMFGAVGCLPRVLPNADILMELEVLKVEEIGDNEMVNELNENISEFKSMEDSKKLIEEGHLRAKDHFVNENFDAAIRVYEKILQILEFAICKNDGDKSEIQQLRVRFLTNIALCYMKKELPKRVISNIDKIEKICSIEENPKILFIKGKALRLLGEFKEANEVLKKANKLRPVDKTIITEMEKLEISVADYNQLSKKMFKNLIN